MGEMEIPDSVKLRIQSLVALDEGKRGILLDRLAAVYEEKFQEPLDYKALGFSYLRELLQAMPEVARVKYDRREESWRVYVNVKGNPFLPKPGQRSIPCTAERSGKQPPQTKTSTRKQGLLWLTGQDAASTCSTDASCEARSLDISQVELVPDLKGLYSICFPCHRIPPDCTDLEAMVSVAGPVAEIQKDQQMVFVRFESSDTVQLAFKLFPYLGLSVARVNIKDRPWEHLEEDTSVEVLVKNLHNHYTVKKVHLEDLFAGFHLQAVEVHWDPALSMQWARVKLATAAEAKRLVSHFNGYNFLGRNLVITIKGHDRSPAPWRKTLLAQPQTLTAAPSCGDPRPEGQGTDVAPDREGPPPREACCQECRLTQHTVNGHTPGRRGESHGENGWMPHTPNGERSVERKERCMGNANAHHVANNESHRREEHVAEKSHADHMPSREVSTRSDEHHAEKSDAERGSSAEIPDRELKTDFAEGRSVRVGYGEEMGHRTAQRSFEENLVSQLRSVRQSTGRGQEGVHQKPQQQGWGLDRGVPTDLKPRHHNSAGQGQGLREEVPHRREPSSCLEDTPRGRKVSNRHALRELKNVTPHLKSVVLERRGDDETPQEANSDQPTSARRGWTEEWKVQVEGGHDFAENIPGTSPVEQRVRQTGVEVPCIFVTNFRRYTTKKELSLLFAKYHPISVWLVESASRSSKRVVKAHIELPDVEMVRRAVTEMNQKKVKGLKVKVDVPFFLPRLRAEVLGEGPVGLPLTEEPEFACSGDCSALWSGDLQHLARQRVKVVESLQTQDFSLSCGEEVEVVVTNVLRDDLLMGLPVWADVMETLSNMSDVISAAADSVAPVNVQARHTLRGPCIVKWRRQCKWHRAWLLSDRTNTAAAAAKVYLLDVGVVDLVVWTWVRCFYSPGVWELPPAALPFRLTEPVVNLKDRLQSQITLSVVDANGKDGIIGAKAVSLVGNWKQKLDLDFAVC